MIEREVAPEFRRFSDSWFVNEYFKHGSVEASVARNDYLPISIANYHKLIKRYGIVGSAGRHTSLPEVLHFFREAALAPDTPLEALYKTMPASFKTSMVTLHRIYNNMEREVVRRSGVALLISPQSDTSRILVGQESEGNRYKHAGNKTIPMGFAKKMEDEDNIESIVRIMQQEVSTANTLKGTFAYKVGSPLVQVLSDQDITPFVQINILDVRVQTFRIVVPDELLTNLSSYKLTNYSFEQPDEVLSLSNLRPGVAEMVATHMTGVCFLLRPLTSHINLSLFA